MMKEVADIINICDLISSKSDTIKEISEAIKDTIKKIQTDTDQIQVPAKSLALRKPLANLFISNSNLDDNIKEFEKIYDDLKKI
ncbi:MAG: hypothetical protein M1308_22370 [Actinobacteria bacterium]|nr:hypothetical protein [Actinomycetota bacterium]